MLEAEDSVKDQKEGKRIHIHNRNRGEEDFDLSAPLLSVSRGGRELPLFLHENFTLPQRADGESRAAGQ